MFGDEGREGRRGEVGGKGEEGRWGDGEVLPTSEVGRRGEREGWTKNALAEQHPETSKYKKIIFRWDIGSFQQTEDNVL